MENHRYRFGLFSEELAREYGDDDPMDGVANLFDIGLVFIVGLIVILFTAYQLQDLNKEQGTVTIMKQNQVGQDVLKRKTKRIEATRVTKQRAKGRGTRLGIAYRLEDGSIVYVPEKSPAH